MWKAEKIELIKHNAYYDREMDWLYINGVLISSHIHQLSVDGCWQNLVCDMCDIEFCNPVGILMMRKKDGKIYIIPDFSEMDGFEEYHNENGTGNRYCAPHEWYEMGCLVVEGELIKQVLDIFRSSIEKVNDFSEEELDLMSEIPTHK